MMRERMRRSDKSRDMADKVVRGLDGAAQTEVTLRPILIDRPTVGTLRPVVHNSGRLAEHFRN